jgi:hypothetical protein
MTLLLVLVLRHIHMRRIFRSRVKNLREAGEGCIMSFTTCARVYPKVSGLAAWNENCKWYSPLPLGAVVSLFCESV